MKTAEEVLRMITNWYFREDVIPPSTKDNPATNNYYLVLDAVTYWLLQNSSESITKGGITAFVQRRIQYSVEEVKVVGIAPSKGSFEEELTYEVIVIPECDEIKFSRAGKRFLGFVSHKQGESVSGPDAFPPLQYPS